MLFSSSSDVVPVSNNSNDDYDDYDYDRFKGIGEDNVIDNSKNIRYSNSHRSSCDSEENVNFLGDGASSSLAPSYVITIVTTPNDKEQQRANVLSGGSISSNFEQNNDIITLDDSYSFSDSFSNLLNTRSGVVSGATESLDSVLGDISKNQRFTQSVSVSVVSSPSV